MKFNKNFTKSFRGGFTLIELLVVIAIIGILSSIVLASLSTARSKANDSKIEEQLSGLRSAAEIYNSTNGGYATGIYTPANCYTTPTSGIATSSAFFGDSTSGAAAIISGIGQTSGFTNMSCTASSTAWAVNVALPSGGTTGATAWCVDSSGKSKSEPLYSTTIAAGACQ